MGRGVRLDINRSVFKPRFYTGTFSGPNPTGELELGTPVAALPGAWRYTARAGTGWLARCQNTVTW